MRTLGTPGRKSRFNLRSLILAGLVLALPVVATGHEPLPAQIRHLSEAIAHDPLDPRLLLERGELYRLAREFEAAERDLEMAARLDPDLDRVHLCRAAL